MESKVIGFEEHYKLPAIQEANRDNPGELVFDVWKKVGRFQTDAQGGWPAGIYDLGEGRIAAMDAAGIDVQILSHTSPGPETRAVPRLRHLADAQPAGRRQRARPRRPRPGFRGGADQRPRQRALP
jgi:predicted TIM-barrel fold metal-dependent hydrolase